MRLKLTKVGLLGLGVKLRSLTQSQSLICGAMTVTVSKLASAPAILIGSITLNADFCTVVLLTWVGAELTFIKCLSYPNDAEVDVMQQLMPTKYPLIRHADTHRHIWILVMASDNIAALGAMRPSRPRANIRNKRVQRGQPMTQFAPGYCWDI